VADNDEGPPAADLIRGRGHWRLAVMSGASVSVS
jgi:hypothetical protein